MAQLSVFSKLYGSIGRHARYAGLGFIALSIIFLVLAVADQFIVFEIDSIVAFLAAIFLLFKDPRARVQVRVLDAIMGYSDQAIGELETFSELGFTYLPTGDRVEEVVVVPAPLEKVAPPDGSRPGAPFEGFTPPGRGLARLYAREVGVTQVTIDALRASLPQAMQENFGLVDSVEIASTDDRVTITLRGASTTCACESNPLLSVWNGSIGCTMASFLAVLVSTATLRAVSLKPCVHDVHADAWTVSMVLGPMVQVSR